MINSDSASPNTLPARALRAGGLLLAAWLLFAVLQVALSVALAPAGARSGWQMELRVNLALGFFWALASVPIAAWHRQLRALGRGPLVLVAGHVPLLVAVMLAAAVATRLAYRVFAPTATLLPFTATFTYYADFVIASYLVVVAFADAFIARDELRERQRLAARLESLLSRARLDFLEAQLQPHFLFNALGAVSELAFEAPATAARILGQLAAIFREAITSKSNERTLGEELVALEPYLDIQRLRFADWLTIERDVDEHAVDCLVPRFVLQPLVENAIRHGLAGRVAAGSIAISARSAGDRLIVSVHDNGVGLKSGSGTRGYGIGLTNVRERLAAMYGGGDHLVLASEGSGTVAQVTIPLRRREQLAATPAASLPDDGPEIASTEAVTAARPSPLRGWQLVAASTLAWIVCGLLWTQQSYAYMIIRHRLGQATWLSVARGDMATALLWAGLAPLVILISSRFALRRHFLAPRLAAYAVGAAALSALHVELRRRLVTPEIPAWSSVYESTLVVDFLIVGVLVAIGHRRQLAEWLQARTRDTAALGTQLRRARERAARLRSIPPTLLQALDRVAAIVRTEPHRTEHLLARLADYLRVAIECSDDEGVTPERERALGRCLAELEESGGFALTTSRGA